MKFDSDSWLITPVDRVDGELCVPGDKSISHRAAMLASLAEGESRISGFLRSEDCLNTLSAVGRLGAEIEWQGDQLLLNGCGGAWKKPDSMLDMGNSGTGIRLLAGLLAGHSFETTLSGDASLQSRPMGRICTPLQEMGARVDTSDGGRAPLTIHGGGLKGIHYPLPMASAQVKSCVLLAGLLAEGCTRVDEPLETRDHTERMLKIMGVPLSVEGLSIRVEGSAGAPLSLQSRDMQIPGDFSSAAFWMVAAACREGGRVTVKSLGLNPRRTALLDVLHRMGATVTIGEVSDSEWEPRATVTIEGAQLCATEIGGCEIPNLIDELPLVAVLGAFAEGETVIRDAAELRVKESDRISAMAHVLTRAGVDVKERPDGMLIRGGSVAGDCEVESFGDHRIAMAMAVLGLGAAAPVFIKGTGCVATSYPGFTDDLMKVVK